MCDLLFNKINLPLLLKHTAFTYLPSKIYTLTLKVYVLENYRLFTYRYTNATYRSTKKLTVYSLIAMENIYRASLTVEKINTY